MKSPSIRLTLLSSLVVACPMLTFAGSQSVGMHVPSKSEMQDRSGVTRAVQQGKGTAITRNQVIRANAYRSQTTEDSRTLKDKVTSAGPNWSDPAFRK
jgi:hypothetical protein